MISLQSMYEEIEMTLTYTRKKYLQKPSQDCDLDFCNAFDDTKRRNPAGEKEMVCPIMHEDYEKVEYNAGQTGEAVNREYILIKKKQTA
jgi:hypothetical protein